jgi:putative membrane protein
MRKATLALFLLASPLPLVTVAGPATADDLTAQDKMFVNEAGGGGLAEVELGQLAQQQAANPEVKQFGQRMVQDHGQANQKLMAIAKELGATPPEKPGEKAEATKRELKGMAGEKFDQAYIRTMIKDHDQTVALFQREAQEGQSEQLRKFAEETLPTIQEHLQMARSIGKQVGVKG